MSAIWPEAVLVTHTQTHTLLSILLFQIDPALLQQTLSSSLLSQPLSVDTGLVSHSSSQLMSSTDPSVSANVVIHPLTSLALQPSTITPAQVTMAGLSEQDATGACATAFNYLDTLSCKLNNGLCLTVRCTGSQDLSHVIGSSGLVAGANSGQEITLTINNSSLTQALAQVQAQASAAGSSAGAGNPQEITLTISGIHSLSLYQNNTNKNTATLQTCCLFMCTE